jgi:hypothetical protein
MIKLSERYSHSGLVLRQSAGRMTRDNLVMLRAAEMKEDKVRKVFASLVTELAALFNGMLFVKPERSTNMCKNYGHVIRGPWYGHLPKCADCGCTISHPSELRKAMPVS